MGSIISIIDASIGHRIWYQPYNPHVVQDLNIAKRVVQIPNSCRPEIQTNRFGVIPKPNQTGKWRLIVDLFHPMEYSVNDGIDSDYCSMRYATASGTSCSKTS